MKLKHFSRFGVVCFCFHPDLFDGWTNRYILIGSQIKVLRLSFLRINNNFIIALILPYLHLFQEILLYNILVALFTVVSVDWHHIVSLNFLHVLFSYVYGAVGAGVVVYCFYLRWASLAALVIWSFIQLLLIKLNLTLMRPMQIKFLNITRLTFIMV